jgi:hypothetical protein
MSAPGHEAKAGAVSFAVANHEAPAEPATVPEVLRAAAGLIEPEGAWVDGWSGNNKTCFCAVSAIRSASGHRGIIADPAIDALRDSLGVRFVVGWNDVPGRTQAEVVAALRKAADLAEADGPLEGQERNEAKPNGLNDLKAKGPQS